MNDRAVDVLVNCWLGKWPVGLHKRLSGNSDAHVVFQTEPANCSCCYFVFCSAFFPSFVYLFVMLFVFQTVDHLITFLTAARRLLVTVLVLVFPPGSPTNLNLRQICTPLWIFFFFLNSSLLLTFLERYQNASQRQRTKTAITNVLIHGRCLKSMTRKVLTGRACCKWAWRLPGHFEG